MSTVGQLEKEGPGSAWTSSSAIESEVVVRRCQVAVNCSLVPPYYREASAIAGHRRRFGLDRAVIIGHGKRKATPGACDGASFGIQRDRAIVEFDYAEICQRRELKQWVLNDPFRRLSCVERGQDVVGSGDTSRYVVDC